MLSEAATVYMFFSPSIMTVHKLKETKTNNPPIPRPNSSKDFHSSQITLHTRGNQLALSPAIRMPAAGIRGLPELLLVLSNAGLQLRAEVSDETLDRPRKGLAQSADRVALDLLREFLEHVDLALLGVAGLETLHYLHRPLAALAARRALTAALVLVERG